MKKISILKTKSLLAKFLAEILAAGFIFEIQ